MSILFDKRYFLFDFARGRSLNKDEIILLFKLLKRAGYNGIGWHIEGFFETKRYKGLVREGCLTLNEAQWICDLAKECSLDIIPIINMVAHAEAFVYYQERFADMRRADSTTQFNLFDKRLESFAHDIIDEVIEIYSPEYLHIGGDETQLNDDEKTEYTAFLSRLCDYIKQKNVFPCVWGDMLLSNDEMFSNFTRDVAVFDWQYFGHSKKTLEKFKTNGFSEVFACPSDQGWDCTIGTQRDFYFSDEITVNYDAMSEIEAFLCDANELGIRNAMVTDWENYNAHNLWAQMNGIVRAGHYMIGKSISDEEIENCIFGKVTPYSEITHILQRIQYDLYIPIHDYSKKSWLNNRMCDAFFSNEVFTLWADMKDAITQSVEKIDKNLDRTIQLLDSWEACGEIETICKTALEVTVAQTKALFSMMDFCAYGYRKYHESAVIQMESPEKAIECLNCVDTYISNMIENVEKFKFLQENYLEFTGQIKRDIARLNAFNASMNGLRARFKEFSNHIAQHKDNIEEMHVLPSWKMLITEIDKFDVMK